MKAGVSAEIWESAGILGGAKLVFADFSNHEDHGHLSVAHCAVKSALMERNSQSRT